MVVSVLLEIKFRHAQINVPKIGIPMLKTACINPCQYTKKKSKQFCSNYRPISLLSNIDKIIEKIMYDRTYKFLDKNNIYPLQFEFQQHYSTSHALLNLRQ